MAPPAPSAAPVTEVVRPDPGLARGVWEWPPAAFYAAVAALALFCLFYTAQRLGLFRRKRRS